MKTAPSTAVPSEPPIERNSVAPEVATPSIVVGHRVLDGEHEDLHHHPEAEAEHEHVQSGDARGVVASSDDSRHMPIAATAVPAIGNTL